MALFTGCREKAQARSASTTAFRTRLEAGFTIFADHYRNENAANFVTMFTLDRQVDLQRGRRLADQVTKYTIERREFAMENLNLDERRAELLRLLDTWRRDRSSSPAFSKREVRLLGKRDSRLTSQLLVSVLLHFPVFARS